MPDLTLTPRPPRSHKTREELAGEAYTMLEVTPDAVAASPCIEHLFKGIGGQARVFEYLSGSEEPEARALLALRARLNKMQAASIPFEAYCVAAGIPVKKMFGIIAAELSDQEAKAKELVFKARHNEVVLATIENALLPLGDKDRKMLHQAAGFVPVPKNSVTHIHGNVDARTQTQNVAILPPVEETVRTLSDRFNAQMVVPMALPAAEEIEDGDEDEE